MRKRRSIRCAKMAAVRDAVFEIAVKYLSPQPPPSTARTNQFDTCPAHSDFLRCQVRLSYDVMSGHVRTKSADFEIYRIWARFVAFWSVLLHCRQHNWCLWISRSHIQLPWGQGHARSRVPWAVSVAHFSRYNSNFTAIQSLGVIV